jgi:hypothetical protein
LYGPTLLLLAVQLLLPHWLQVQLLNHHWHWRHHQHQQQQQQQRVVRSAAKLLVLLTAVRLCRRLQQTGLHQHCALMHLWSPLTLLLVLLLVLVLVLLLTLALQVLLMLRVLLLVVALLLLLVVLLV